MWYSMYSRHVFLLGGGEKVETRITQTRDFSQMEETSQHTRSRSDAGERFSWEESTASWHSFLLNLITHLMRTFSPRTGKVLNPCPLPRASPLSLLLYTQTLPGFLMISPPGRRQPSKETMTTTSWKKSQKQVLHRLIRL